MCLKAPRFHRFIAPPSPELTALISPLAGSFGVNGLPLEIHFKPLEIIHSGDDGEDVTGGASWSCLSMKTRRQALKAADDKAKDQNPRSGERPLAHVTHSV